MNPTVPGPPRIWLADATHLPPFAVEAFVVEQDRDLLLEWQSEIAPVTASVTELVGEMREARPPPVGSVRVRGGARPLTLLAIVHDFSAEPSCRVAWVEAALAALLDAVTARGLTTLALPLLGTVHGRLDRVQVAALIGAALARGPATALERVWLLTAAGDTPALAGPLRAAGLDVELG